MINTWPIFIIRLLGIIIKKNLKSKEKVIMENTKIPIGTVDLRELDDIALAACIFHLSSALFPGIQGSSAECVKLFL